MGYKSNRDFTVNRRLKEIIEEESKKTTAIAEIVLYRVPGEIGFYGAKHLPGTRHMAAEENPAYRPAHTKIPGKYGCNGCICQVFLSLVNLKIIHGDKFQ